MSLPAEFYEGVNVSPQKLEVETACAATCQPSLEGYRGCQSRLTPAMIKEGGGLRLSVAGRFFSRFFSPGRNCGPAYLDFWHCVDECSAKKLFAKLK